MPRFRHPKTGHTIALPRNPGGAWVRMPDRREPTDSTRPFDPAQHDTPAVAAYLAATSPRERKRVLALERRGRARRELLRDAPGALPPMERGG